MELTKLFRIVGHEQPLKDENSYLGDDKYNYVASLYDPNLPTNGSLDFDVGDIDELRRQGIRSPRDLDGKLLVVKFTPRELDDSRYVMEQMDRNDFDLLKIKREDVTSIRLDRDRQGRWTRYVGNSLIYTAELIAYKRMPGANLLFVDIHEQEYSALKANPPLILRAEFSFKDE